STSITNSVLLWGVGIDIVERAALGTDAPTAETFHYRLGIQRQDDHGTEIQLMFFEQLFHDAYLRERAGKSVKQNKITFPLSQLMGNDALNNLHRHKLPCSFVGFDFFPQGRPLSYFLFQQIAGFNYSDAVACGE